MRVAGGSVHDTALGEVSIAVEPSVPGRVDVFIPLANWGIRSRPFDAPLALNVQARSVEREALIRAAGGDRTVLGSAREDAREAVVSALLRAVLWAALGALALAAMLVLAVGGRLGSVRRRIVLVAATTATAAALSGGSALLTGWTFDAAAFDQPSFYARGAELYQLLDVAEEGQEAADGYRSQVDRTLGGYARILAGAARLAGDGEPDSVALASDLHGNRAVLDALGEVFGDQPIYFAGDFGQSGSRAEADVLVPPVAGLGDEVIAVSGNHDSRLIMDSLERAGVRVLDGRAADLGGRGVAGWPDPLEWRARDPANPARIFSFGEMSDGDRRFERAQADLIAWFDELPKRPDMVMVHQNGLAQGLARHVSEGSERSEPLTILTGHDHEQHVDRYGDVVVVDAGSTGAGGVFGLGTQAIGMANLHFLDDTLRAVDMIQIEPVSGEAQAQRIVPFAEEACDEDILVCRDEGEESPD
jgi:Icc-related predicted phosphoesterase